MAQVQAALSIALALTAIAPATTAVADEFVDQFANCSGVYDVASDIMKDAKPNTAKLLQNMGNGAEIATASLVVSELNTDDFGASWRKAVIYAQNQRDIRRTYWLAVVELNGADEQFEKALDFCMKLAPIQEEIINEVRRLGYGLN